MITEYIWKHWMAHWGLSTAVTVYSSQDCCAFLRLFLFVTPRRSAYRAHVVGSMESKYVLNPGHLLKRQHQNLDYHAKLLFIFSIGMWKISLYNWGSNNPSWLWVFRFVMWNRMLKKRIKLFLYRSDLRICFCIVSCVGFIPIFAAIFAVRHINSSLTTVFGLYVLILISHISGVVDLFDKLK